MQRKEEKIFHFTLFGGGHNLHERPLIDLTCVSQFTTITSDTTSRHSLSRSELEDHFSQVFLTLQTDQHTRHHDIPLHRDSVRLSENKTQENHNIGFGGF